MGKMVCQLAIKTTIFEAKKGMRNLIAFVFSFVYAASLMGQAARLEGIVSNADSGEPIPNLNLSIVKEGKCFITSTDSKGTYSTTDLDPGIYSVSFGKVGFELFVKDVVVHANMVQNFDVSICYFDGINCSEVKYLEPLIRPWELSSVTNFMSKDLRRFPFR
ncbi:MAG: carboxypeptidase regulatory-like domain-containing protein [Saprospiraceae bacterium]|nr:carboxypeptidase regulatory-like domain-containing protein [Saprospiraceae bacterium]